MTLLLVHSCIYNTLVISHCLHIPITYSAYLFFSCLEFVVVVGYSNINECCFCRDFILLKLPLDGYIDTAIKLF